LLPQENAMHETIGRLARTPVPRRRILRAGAAAAASVAVAGPLHALGAQTALGARPKLSTGYGPLVNKGDLWLPEAFNYQVLSTQGEPMSDGNPTPGIFDGTAAYGGRGDTTILIRNHENRERSGETKVQTDSALQYDAAMAGGNTKLVIRRRPNGHDEASGQKLYQYEILEQWAILGGTSTNCAGGTTPWDSWVTCEEVVKNGPDGTRHGYNFEVDAHADGPVAAEPIVNAGRFAHEASAWYAGALYQTEDRSITPDLMPPDGPGGLIGGGFYRYIPDGNVSRAGDLASSTGTLQALAIVDEPNANMNVNRSTSLRLPVEWVDIDEPDHGGTNDNGLARTPGLTPVAVQAKDGGAALFNRPEGLWVGANDRIYFDCTSGGEALSGQVWEYDDAAGTLTLIFESPGADVLDSPDNVVIVPQSGDVFLCEDGDSEQFIRGVTLDGEIYDFARTTFNETEFAGAAFDPRGHTLYVSQQGDRPGTDLETRAVTYAIYGPF
jgi:secreted PhoX family phosphatase